MYSGISGLNQTGTGIVPSGTGRKKKDKARMSADQVLQMMKEVETRFIRPKPQAELGGALGVTLLDMAKSLGVLHKDLRNKVESELNILTHFNYKVRKNFHTSADNKTVESYVLDVMAANFILGGYNNLAGRIYRDFLIRCKDALKVSLEDHQKLETELNKVSSELTESNKKLEAFLQPKITRRNNIIRRKAVKEPDGLFHEGKYRVETEIYKQPKKEDENYDEHKVQKLSRIAFGTVGAIEKSCKENNCDSEVLNFVVKRFMECAKYADTLINPEDPEQYAETRKELERIMNA